MTVAAYDRFLERAAHWGFDSARLRQHLRTAFAACLAVLAAWALGLEHPQWAGMTVWAASQPLRGQLLEKSFFRTTGTAVGTAAGIGLVLLAHGDLLWLVTGLALWLGLCAGLGNLQRGFASYGTMLSGYSAAMVALLDAGHPEHVYALGWDRLFTGLTGVAAALVVGWLFTPVGGEIPGNGQVRRLCARLLRDIAAAARGQAGFSRQALAERLSAMAVIEEGLDPHAAGSQRSRRAVRALRRLINTQISALLWLRDDASQQRGAHFAPAQATTLAEALEQAALALETQSLPQSAVDQLARAGAAAAGWGAAQGLIENLRLALHAHLVASTDEPLSPQHRARQLPVVLHRDWVGARRAALRAALAVFIVGMVWVLTGWSGGIYMLLGLSIMITVFSSFENPAFTMRYVTAGQALGVLVALACQWLAWPFAHSQLQMVLWMMPFIVLGALLFSHRRTMLSGYDCNMVLLLLLSPHYPQTGTLLHSLALGFAVVTGPLAGWATYRFLLPVTLQGRLQALRAMMVHEIQDMAARPLATRDASADERTQRVWRARLYHRLLRLVRTAEKAGAQQAQAAADCGLAALRVGKSVYLLQTLSRDGSLGESTARCVRSALLRLQRLQSAPAKALPLLEAVGRRIAPQAPEKALLLQQAAQDIARHPEFFAARA